MSDNNVRASFSFKKYRIEKFTFENPSRNAENVKIHFAPSGELNLNNNIYRLNLTLLASYPKEAEDIPFINVELSATFEFDSEINIDDIPEYFYGNSIAIVYPFLRAFVSTLTVLAQVQPIILPILNLTSLNKELRDNTIIIEKTL